MKETDLCSYQVNSLSRSDAKAVGKMRISMLRLFSICATLFSVNLTSFEAQGEVVTAPECGNGTTREAIVILSSGVAFRLPQGNYVLRGGAHPPDEDGLPPEGCPGNPILTQGITFPIRAPSAEDIARGVPAAVPDKLTIYGHSGPVAVQQGHLRGYQAYLQRGHHCELVGGILTACRSCWEPNLDAMTCRIEGEGALRRTLPLSDMPTLYKVNPGTYPEPNGVPFAGRCTWLNRLHRMANHGRPCTFGYELIEGVSLRYSFNDADVPEDQFIAFDQFIRHQVLEARTPQYDQPVMNESTSQ